MNMTSFEIYCKDFIRENIEGLIGRNVYACDLGLELTMGINADGTCTYSTNLAKQYLCDWWDECGDYWDYEKKYYGENAHNPFVNPEAYMVCMVIEGVRTLLGQVKEIDADWGSEINVTKELCDSICSQLDEIEMYNSRGYVNW